eukprot:TRINITY_DN1110_c0_g1_i1.p1 TRINITY_DN1110_c0_g1~~TRINITY_DN1110_c0_g1_i1.p1  ORF type:complete len:778 (-),score=218.32 TRINITY_DN1110_c0_g1_i1:81-2342(-)
MDKLSISEDPPRPVEGKRNILITSALPYVNNVPHLGNIIGSTLSADVFSRYCKGRGENCIYVCGTDEYGTATETKAQSEGVSPKEVCDKFHAIHAETYEWFDIAFDKFGRTSEPLQTEITQEIFMKIRANGYTFEKEIEQLYCEKCPKFLADRYVEGTCPYCAYKDARGDQCDGCGKMINATELINPLCKTDGTRPILRKTTHIYLDLPKLVEKQQAWFQEAHVKGRWSNNSTTITKSTVNTIEPRCITRDLKWGVPVPLEGWEKKVFYVWFDAPIGYISITAALTPHWREWWLNPKNVQLYQFMGKDNVGFHTVMFPSCLLGTGQPYTLLHHVNTTEYLNYENQKFSKSRGIGVFGTDAKLTGIPSEVWRYYLLVNRPETSDSSFSWDDLADKVNNELLANVGNFVNRATTFVAKNFGGKVPSSNLTEEDKTFINNVNVELQKYLQAMNEVSIKEGLKQAMLIGQMGNKYFNDTKPWDLFAPKPKEGESEEQRAQRQTEGKERCKTVLTVTLNFARFLALILSPFMPGLSRKIFKQLNWTKNDLIPDSFTLELNEGHVLGTPEILVQKLTADQIKSFKEKFGTKEEKAAFPIDVRGAVVESVEDHPNDPENLYVVKLNIGKESRTAVARLKAVHPNKEDLLNRRVVVLCNLPKTSIKDVESTAMLLTSDNKKSGLKLLEPKGTFSGNWEGTVIGANGLEVPNEIPSITLKEFQKLDLKVNAEGNVVYLGKHVWEAQNTEKSNIQGEKASKIK